MKCMRIVISVILLFAIKPAYAAADADTDTLSVLSRVEGADMTLYSLYRDYRFSDKDKAMEYAELFLSRVDSLSLEPCLAPLYTKSLTGMRWKDAGFPWQSVIWKGLWKSIMPLRTGITKP